ncbi:hypothetical protein ACLVX8_24595 [Klebsiella pneumoniae]
MNHPVESVYSALTSILLPYMGEPVPVQRNCSCCGRAPSEFDGVGFELVNAYRERVVHCRPCQTFFVSAPELMGVENPKKPTTGQKFGMWSGVGAVINVEDNSSVLLGKVRISTLRNENETFSQLNSITYIGVFLRLVTYSHLP